MKILFKQNKTIKKDNFFEILQKAISNIESNEESEYLFEREYIETYLKLLNDIFNSIIDGLALKINVDPTLIRKSFKFNSLTLIKASDNEITEKALLLKSLWTDLRDKYKKSLPDYKKYFSKYKPLEPMKLNSSFIYNPNTKNNLTTDEWKELENGVVTSLKNSIGNADEELVVRAGLFGLLKRLMDEENIPKEKQKKTSYDELMERYGTFLSDKNKAKTELFKKKQMKKTIEYAQEHAAQYLSIRDDYKTPTGENLKNRIINIFRKQIAGGLQDGISKQEMISRLYWIDPSDQLGKRFNEDTITAYNRDLARIVNTEFAFANNEAYLAATKDEAKKDEKLYFVFAGRHNPKEKPNEACNRFLGKVALLVDEPKGDDTSFDPNAQYLIWSGKTNVGRKGNDLWFCIPVHPNCVHNLERIYPEFQEYDKEHGIIVMKDLGKSFNDEELNLIKNDPIKKTINLLGFKIAIEWNKGETREYPESPYKNLMQYDYGYLLKTNSPDGEEIDVCINRPIKQRKIIHMLIQKIDGKYDEIKFGIGFSNAAEFKNKYIKTMTENMFGGIFPMTIKKFKEEIKFYWKKKQLNKSIQNIDIDKEKIKPIKEKLTDIINKIKKELKLKSKIIIRLYKENNKDKSIRGLNDEGIIILYLASDDIYGDCIHEIGHQVYHEYKLDNNKKINTELKELIKEIKSEKDYNRIFANEHVISNEMEIFATLFKWFLSGKIIDTSYIDVLKEVCENGYELIKKIIEDNKKENKK